MDWAVLVISGLMEAVWATALDRIDGFSNVVPIVVFVVGLSASMIGLGYAVRTLPIGVAYAVWTGIGVIATATFSMATGNESASVVKVLLLAGLIACIAGLRLVSD